MYLMSYLNPFQYTNLAIGECPSQFNLGNLLGFVFVLHYTVPHCIKLRKGIMEQP